ncbi:MAG: HDOD domain-containing protein [Desulfobulbaceae bacterium]|nr:HDOD domain-containing protein [Desulfobulbaceae bacterium]
MNTKDIIEKVGELPTLPTIAARINSEMQNESLTAKLLGKILSDDTSLTAKVLRLANSAFYGMPKKVTSVEKAVMILGFNTVKNLALSVSIYSFFKTNKKTKIDVLGLWNHSLACAVCSQMLIEKTCKRLGDDAFLFGIIHDIGKVILINIKLDDMEKVIQIMNDREIIQNEAEEEVFGFTHQKIGTLLLRQWNFPENLIAGVRLHHDLPPITKKLDQDTAQLVKALCVGNQLSKALSLGKSTDPKRQTVPRSMFKSLGFNKEDLPGLCTLIKENYTQFIEAWKME